MQQQRHDQTERAEQKTGPSVSIPAATKVSSQPFIHVTLSVLRSLGAVNLKDEASTETTATSSSSSSSSSHHQASKYTSNCEVLSTKFITNVLLQEAASNSKDELPPCALGTMCCAYQATSDIKGFDFTLGRPALSSSSSSSSSSSTSSSSSYSTKRGHRGAAGCVLVQLVSPSELKAWKEKGTKLKPRMCILDYFMLAEELSINTQFGTADVAHGGTGLHNRIQACDFGVMMGKQGEFHRSVCMLPSTKGFNGLRHPIFRHIPRLMQWVYDAHSDRWSVDLSKFIQPSDEVPDVLESFFV